MLVFKCTMLGISSVLMKHQPSILFWTLFDSWATRWERPAGTRYQYLVPEVTIGTLKQRKTLLKFTSPSMVRKICRLKCSHNLLSANKFKFDPTENLNFAELGGLHLWNNSNKYFLCLRASLFWKTSQWIFSFLFILFPFKPFKAKFLIYIFQLSSYLKERL